MDILPLLTLDRLDNLSVTMAALHGRDLDERRDELDLLSYHAGFACAVRAMLIALRET